MGFLNSLFGGTSSFNAQGVNQGNINQATQGVQGGLGQQQGFVNALQGLGATGIGAQQQGLQGLEGVANGTGPNPALAMLNQQTGQNVTQQASLMGSQRGVGSNAGLLARQAAQQGANIQQNAIGQGASLAAQQQLGALNQLGAQGAAAVGQQGAALSNLNQFQQNNQGQILGANAQQNATNAGTANQNASNNSSFTKGLFGFSQGGSIPGYAEGIPGLGLDMSMPNIGVAPPSVTASPSEPQSSLGKAFAGVKNAALSAPIGKIASGVAGTFMSSGGHVPGQPRVFGDSEKNDTVPAMLSPGEIVVPRTKAHDPKAAAKFAAAVALRNKRK